MRCVVFSIMSIRSNLTLFFLKKIIALKPPWLYIVFRVFLGASEAQSVSAFALTGWAALLWCLGHEFASRVRRFVVGALWGFILGPPSSAARLHKKGGVLCVTVYGSVQDKDPLGDFGLRKSKAIASRPGFLIWRPNNINVVLVEP